MATSTDRQPPLRFEGTTYARLIQEAKAAGSTEQAWLYLEAAHVVGQLRFTQHVQTHTHMLGLALRTRDWLESLGQLLRLALVPMGHLSGRLPLGNPGRATVGAFKPMPVRQELVELIKQAARKLS